MILTELESGHRGVVFSVEFKRLSDIGFVPGALIEMLRSGDPCIVRVEESRVGLSLVYQESILINQNVPSSNLGRPIRNIAMTFDCEKCGKVNGVIIDGYGFAGGLLEGVKFMVSLADDGSLSVKAQPEDEVFFEQFNKEMWLSKATEYVEQHEDDEDDCCGACPVCGQDLIIEGEQGKNCRS